MYICKKRKLVYFRIPKAGSTTFVQSCRFWTAVDGDHQTYLEAKSQPHWGQYEDFRRITVIRHPFEWARSVYWMCVRATQHWAEFVSKPKKRDATFSWFLENWDGPTQLDWATDERGGIQAKVYKIEDLSSICEEFGVTPKERLNKTDITRPVKWSGDDEALMRERFAREMEFYP